MRVKISMILGALVLMVYACGGSSDAEKQEIQAQSEQEVNDMLDEMNQSMSGDSASSDTSAAHAHEGHDHEGHTH